MDISKQKKVLEEEKAKQQKLMFSLSEDIQRDIVEMVIKDVEDDEKSRTEFMENRKEIIELYEGIKKEKNDPFPNCANVKTMIVAMVVELLHSRLFPAVFNEDLVYWIPQEKSDIATADNIGKFMKWALRNMKFGQFVDDFVKNLVLEGTAVAKIRWETEYRWVQRKIPKESKIINRIKNVILNLFGKKTTVRTTDEDFEVIYDYKKFENCVVELIPLEDVGFPPYSIPGSDENKLRHIWHRTRPFIDDLRQKQDEGWFINVDKISDWVVNQLTQGTEKTKMEAEGVRKVNLEKERYPLELIEWYGKYNVPGYGKIECIFWVEKNSKTYLGGMPLVNVSRINRRPFVIAQLVRRTNRMYGKGIADFVKELQKEMDSIYNQYLDAGTMTIIPPGVYRAASGMTPEEIQLKPGLWIPLDDVNDAKWIVMPNNVLISYQAIRMLMELIEKISSVGAYQSGQESDIVRTRATARGTLAIIAQGEVRFNTLAKRIQQSLAKILVHILQQYQQNIPPGLEQRILGDSGEPIFPEGISPEDIAGNYDVYLGLDSTGGSKILERETAAILYQGMISNPLILSNPAGLWELTADTLRAAGKLDVERYIGPKPQVPQEITKTVAEENALIMQGKQVYTKPTDNVMEHLLGHLYFAQSPEGLNLTPEARRLLDLHILETKRQLVQMVSQEISGLGGGNLDVERFATGGIAEPVLERPYPAETETGVGTPETTSPNLPEVGGV